MYEMRLFDRYHCLFTFWSTSSFIDHDMRKLPRFALTWNDGVECVWISWLILRKLRDTHICNAWHLSCVVFVLRSRYCPSLHPVLHSLTFAPILLTSFYSLLPVSSVVLYLSMLFLRCYILSNLEYDSPPDDEHLQWNTKRRSIVVQTKVLKLILYHHNIMYWI